MRSVHSSIILGLLMVTLRAPGSAGAAAETGHFSGSGESAEVSFRSIDATGCIETTVAISAVEERVKADGAPSERRSWAAAFVNRFDSCTATPLVSAIGSVDLAPDAFRIDKLETATLVTTMSLEDAISGTTITLDLNVTWQANAEPVRVTEHRQIKERDLTINTRMDGTRCGATASGTVSDGTTNFTPEPGFGLLSSGKAMEVVVERG